jgi:hypothetical protein
VEALKKLGPLNLEATLHVLSHSYYAPPRSAYFVFQAHFLAGGDQKNERVIAWLGRRLAGLSTPLDRATTNRDESRATLEVFKEAWELSEATPQLRQDLGWLIARVVSRVRWESGDLSLLEDHEQNLHKAGLASETIAVQQVIRFFETRNWIGVAGVIWFAHALFWFFLITLYPMFPQIQAIFFWNPWVRRVLGLGYVGFLLTWVPCLRARLLAPFKASLLADADLENFDASAYFQDSQVRLKTSTQSWLITSAIPVIKRTIDPRR